MEYSLASNSQGNIGVFFGLCFRETHIGTTEIFLTIENLLIWRCPIALEEWEGTMEQLCTHLPTGWDSTPRFLMMRMWGETGSQCFHLLTARSFHLYPKFYGGGWDNYQKRIYKPLSVWRLYWNVVVPDVHAEAYTCDSLFGKSQGMGTILTDMASYLRADRDWQKLQGYGAVPAFCI